MADVKEYICDKNERLDTFLASKISQTRSQVAHLIKQGAVSVDDKCVTRPGVKLKEEQKISIVFPQAQTKEIDQNFMQETSWAKEVKIIYEDEELIVINKPSGVTVHPAPSVKEPTLVDWLKYQGMSLSTISGEERHGIVHRLDKGTSGAMVVAKSNEAHEFLSKQLQDKSMGRYYLAIITPPLKDDLTTVEANIARSASNRLKMASGLAHGKYAKTQFKQLALSGDAKLQLVACKLFTGRTHQIRVHLESLNRHIIGDHIYALAPKNAQSERIMLHAYIIYFTHPITKKRIEFKAELDTSVQQFLEEKFDMESANEILAAKHIVECFTTDT